MLEPAQVQVDVMDAKLVLTLVAVIGILLSFLWRVDVGSSVTFGAFLVYFIYTKRGKEKVEEH
ncbi:MAG: hypothetical protein C9356_19805 [Oleiphilus sp.]|nr:MAG: hypothetical protein C9356_19805 [Oleiphilus sp.]